MILDALLGWIAGLLEAAARLLPSWTPNIPTAAPLATYLDDLNWFLPIAEVMTIVLGVLVLGVPMGLVSIALWVGVGVVRGGSSSG